MSGFSSKLTKSSYFKGFFEDFFFNFVKKRNKKVDFVMKKSTAEKRRCSMFFKIIFPRGSMQDQGLREEDCFSFCGR